MEEEEEGEEEEEEEGEDRWVAPMMAGSEDVLGSEWLTVKWLTQPALNCSVNCSLPAHCYFVP